MTEPNYFIQFEKNYNDRYLIDEFIESFDVEDWKQLFSDLANFSPYPFGILTELRDLDVITTFGLKIKLASEATKLKVGVALNQLVDANIQLEAPGASNLFVTLIEIARFLQKGIEASKLIKLIILDQRQSHAVRYDASIALAMYHDDKEAVYFWTGAAKDLLSSNQFLSFPRFLFFSEIDTLEAVYSLRYFEKTEYITEADLRLQISYFFLRVATVDEELMILKNNYPLFSPWLKQFIESNVLTGKEFERIKNSFIHDSSSRFIIETRSSTSRHRNIDIVWKKADSFAIMNVKNSINARIKHYLPSSTDLDYYRKGPDDLSHNYHEFQFESEELVKTLRYAKLVLGRSELTHALNLYKNVLDDLYKIKDLNIAFLAIYPQILADIANIYSVSQDFRTAREMFFDSMQACYFLMDHNKKLIRKNTINILGLWSFEPHLNPDWDKPLWDIAILTTKPIDYGLDIEDKGDIYYYLCNGYFRTKDIHNFNKSFNEGIKLTGKSYGAINEIKLFVLKILIENKQVDIDHIRQLIDRLDKDQKKDPKITTLLPSLKTVELEKDSSIGEIEAIFIENDIVIS